MADHDQTNKAPRSEICEDIEHFRSLAGDHGRLLGLDLGTRTIGLALSDLLRMIASPLETLARKKFSRDATQLEAVITEHDIAGLVLGLPRNLDGSEGPRAQSTRAFARNLSHRQAPPILLWDERLTTAAAERVLLEADTSRARRAEVIDKMAAAIILQSALDRLAIDPNRDQA